MAPYIQATYLAFTLSVLVTVALSGYGYGAVRAAAARRRLRIFMVCSAAAVLPLSLLSMVPRVLTQGHVAFPFGLTVLPLMLYPSAYLYTQLGGRLALTRHDVHISSFVTYFITAVLLLALYMCGLIALGALFGVRVSSPTPDAAATVIALLAAQPIGKSVRRLTRWAWADETTEPLKLARDLAAQLARTVEPEQLRTPLTTTLANGLCLTGAALLRVENGVTMSASGSGALGWVTGQLAIGSDIRRKLIETRVKHGPLAPLHLLPINVLALCGRSEVGPAPMVTPTIVLPLVLHDEVLGVLLLGPRQPDGRSDFTVEETDCLSTVADHAATAMHTIRLIEERERYGDEMTDLLDRERERIGDSLHHGPIQALIALGWALDGLMSTNSGSADRKELLRALAEVRMKVARIVENLRGTMYSIESPGFVPAVMRALDTIETDWQGQSPVVQRVISGDLAHVDMPREVRTGLVEIVREAVANACKHAQATSISVTITTHNMPDSEARGVVVDIHDDGRGANFAGQPEAVMDRHHSGLYRMRRRARKVDAVLSFPPAPGAGTHVRIEWPKYRM